MAVVVAPMPTVDMVPVGEIPFSPKPAPSGWALVDDVEIRHMPDPAWAIEGVIPDKGFGVVYGPPGCGKTTLEARIEVAQAKGGSFFGRAVKVQGGTLYCGEDRYGWKTRLLAAKKDAGLPASRPSGIYTFTGDPIDLRDTGLVDRFIGYVKASNPFLGTIVFDTLAAHTPGASENNSEDMTLAITNCLRIRDRLNVGVRLLHHSNAGGTRERGHSAIRGAADYMLALTVSDDVVIVESSKQRHGPAFEPLRLKLVPTTDGSCVILRQEHEVLASPDPTPTQARVLQVLREIAGSDGVTSAQWRAACPDIPERSFFRAVTRAQERGWIAKVGPKRDHYLPGKTP